MHFQVTSPRLIDQVRVLGLWVLAGLAGLVIPLLFIGRGAAAILVPIIGGIAASLILRPAWLQRVADWRRDPFAIAIGVMLLAWLLSVFGSLRPGFSFAIWLQVAGLLLMIAAVPKLIAETRATLTLALQVLLVASAIGTAIAAISIYLWPQLLSFVRPVDSPYTYVAAQRLKSYSAVMPCLAPVLLWAGIRVGRVWAGLAVLTVVLGALVVHGTGNRAALGGYFGALAVPLMIVLIFRVPARLRAAIIGAIALAILAAGALIVSHLPNMPFDGTQKPELPVWFVDQHRQVIWGFVFDRALERPWLGWGPSMANFLPGADDPIPVIGQTFVPLHAHNWVIQLFNDVGVVGLVAAVAVIILLLRDLARIARVNSAGWAALSLTGAFLLSTLANFSIWQSWWQSVFVILLSISLAGTYAPGNGGEVPRPAR